MVQTAAAAIIHNNKILLVKRSKSVDRYPCFWTLPGGKAEGNETPKENVIREVKEEINLEFNPTLLVSKPDSSDNGSYIFTGIVTGKIILQEEELDEFKWFTYSECLDLNIAFNFKDVIKILNSNNLI